MRLVIFFSVISLCWAVDTYSGKKNNKIMSSRIFEKLTSESFSTWACWIRDDYSQLGGAPMHARGNNNIVKSRRSNLAVLLVLHLSAVL